MPTAISTFSGSGGSSLGLRRAGFDVPVAMEFMPLAAQSYRLNSPGAQVVEKDIRTVKGEELLALAGVKAGELDLLEGSPPCSAFSMNGVREKGWGKEKKYSKTRQRVDDLFFEYLRLVSEIRPRACIMENVSGMSRGNARLYLNAVVRDLRELGYGRVDVREYDAVWFGVPQHRKRLVFVALRDDVEGEFRPPTPQHRIETVGTAFYACPAPSCPEEEGRKLSPGSMGLALWEKTAPGDGFDKAARRTYLKNGWYNHTKLCWSKPSPCVINCDSVYHPRVPRSVTIPELRRLSGFPDDWKLVGGRHDRWERLARTVVPPMYDAIGSKIREALEVGHG